MAKKSTSKITINLVTKSLYPGSGPRGIDVYAQSLYAALLARARMINVILTHDVQSKTKIDVVHYTFFDPFFLTLWGRVHRNKYIVTVHDLIPLVFPTHFSTGLRGRVKWLLQKIALRQANAIITDSVCSQKDISRLANIKMDKIHVVALAGGHTVAPVSLIKQMHDEYAIPEKYILYVGDINWNKNVPGLIKAFSALPISDVHLVLVGKAFKSSQDTHEYQAIAKSIVKSGKSEFIHLIGFVPNHHLSAIYRGAMLYVQPSWYEGFGFPVIEALEQGTPVACASTGSLPEVGGVYVHYFDPHDQKSFIVLLKKLLSHEDIRTQFSVSGKKWAETFTWESVVKNTYAVYEKVI